VLQLQPINLPRPRPVELIEGLAHGEACEPDTALDGTVLAQRRFTLDEAHERCEMIGAGGGRLADELDVVLADERQTEIVEMLEEGGFVMIVTATHRWAPGLWV